MPAMEPIRAIPVRFKPLLSSIGVTALVILTSLLLIVLAWLLYWSSRGVVKPGFQSVLVVAAVVGFSLLSIGGLVAAVFDIVRRVQDRRVRRALQAAQAEPAEGQIYA